MKFSFFISIGIFSLSFFVNNSYSATKLYYPLDSSNNGKKYLNNSIFIQIFKEERVLELYTKNEKGLFSLFKSYPICNFSGGLGPKKRQGDLKSPEGFYRITRSQLKPDSKYYRAFNLGFPNKYDQAHGYTGAYLMVHGGCKSIGCYAMTDRYINEIYRYVENALQNGQYEIQVNIYPFKMTSNNMNRHRNSRYYTFWRQLQPAYEYFTKTNQLPVINIQQGQYLVNKFPNHQSSPAKADERLQYALTKME
ncbi:hypothetical protein CBG25_17635 [Arsenophonus sp. ENCA]|uniref:L,D-transpeptidase family protein n=1 Tax=Arsenophonus sp. ENCA TaxID=1987579 RepID=UPI000BDBD515|nr:murein L,D-transpeptidase family protein [Arsenophonus sp. ENCA]PAV01270.1 hypothetical protein CBG25_17635 [Arsenophonus sp. ENCA]